MPSRLWAPYRRSGRHPRPLLSTHQVFGSVRRMDSERKIRRYAACATIAFEKPWLLSFDPLYAAFSVVRRSSGLAFAWNGHRRPAQIARGGLPAKSIRNLLAWYALRRSRPGIRRAQTKRINRAVDEALQSTDAEAVLALMALAADEATIRLCDHVFRRATRLAWRDRTETAAVIAACWRSTHTVRQRGGSVPGATAPAPPTPVGGAPASAWF